MPEQAAAHGGLCVVEQTQECIFHLRVKPVRFHDGGNEEEIRLVATRYRHIAAIT
jgi:hypothetical protein